jgi:1-pyrroline-4-hydroxy-2-carboxylate deaminase
MNWTGVLTAITTPFTANGDVDHEFLGRHAAWLLDNGCTGLVPLGSLGEGATLSHEEKRAVLRTCVQAAGGRAPVIAGIAGLSTREAVSLAQLSAENGCQGLMVLPPYVYSTDWREMKAHVKTVMESTNLPCLLYNNPVAYTTDFLPEHVLELAGEVRQLEAVKESSTDPRRIASLRSLVGKRLTLLVGLDPLVATGVHAGARGWIAGVSNALPRECVTLFESALNRDEERTRLYYDWLLPLLNMDAVPKFVQLIKLMQAEVGMGSANVRAPRLQLVDAELTRAQTMIRRVLSRRAEFSRP